MNTPDTRNPLSTAELLAFWEEQLELARRERADSAAAHIEAERREQVAMSREDAVEQIVRGLRQLNDNERQEEAAQTTGRIEPGGVVVTLAPPVEEETPRGQEAVLRVLRSSPPRAWRVQELVDEISRFGWFDRDAKNKYASVSVALRRLKDAGKVDQVGKGLYRIRPMGADDGQSDGEAHDSEGGESQ
jgi:hypothetical protein